MSGIFAGLAVADIVLFVASVVLGLSVSGDRLYAEHFILALFTAILTALIHAVVLTYFSVTGRMMSQAIFIGGLDHRPLEQIRRSKSYLIRYAGPAIMMLVMVIALGALSARDSSWHLYHFAAAGVVIMVNTVAFYKEYGLIVSNGTLMDEVLAEYEAKRNDSLPPTTTG